MPRKPCVALTRRSGVAALFLALAVAAPALAAPIDYIFTGVLTGSFYGGASGDQSVTIIATGDAAAVTAASTCNNLGSVRVAIPGKMATVTEPMAIFVDRPARNLGLRRGTCGAPLSPWLVVNNAVVFGSYSLAASLVPGPVVPTPSGLGSVSTTLGVLDVVANVLSSFEAQGPNPPPSGNAKLSGLALSSGLLTPAVNGNTFQYTGRVADGVASVTLTPTAADPAASILVNGAPVASGSASAPIALASGENRVTIAVTAPDGFATQSYVVNVIRLDPNYQGLWWKSPPGSESGWGINFAHQGDVIFATWFTYRDDGKPWWLIAELHKVANGRYTGSIATVSGPAFNSVPFEPALVQEALVGTMTVTFTGAADGVLETNVEGFAQTKPITRQVFGLLPVCTWGTQADLAPADELPGPVVEGERVGLGHQLHAPGRRHLRHVVHLRRRRQAVVADRGAAQGRRRRIRGHGHAR